MWHDHILQVDHMSLTGLSILLTWPYHRTLQYFTIAPAQTLAKSFDNGDIEALGEAVRHWVELKTWESHFVYTAVLPPPKQNHATDLSTNTQP